MFLVTCDLVFFGRCSSRHRSAFSLLPRKRSNVWLDSLLYLISRFCWFVSWGANLIDLHIPAGEDVVAFYHKNFSAYLSYDPSLQATPMYYKSQRVNAKSRKKSCWMWKIEKNNLQGPGAGIISLLLTLVCAYPCQ